MSQLFSDAQITRHSRAAQELIAQEYPCILERTSIAITAGTSEYTLDSRIFSIRKIMWKGEKIDPISHRNFRDKSGFTATGTPCEYVFNSLGQNIIKFFPAPSISISALSSGLYGQNIRDGVVIEYYRLPDFVSSFPFVFHRRLIKCYVMKMCFATEGKTQDLKASKYFDNKWKILKDLYGNSLLELLNSSRRIIVGGSFYDRNNSIPTPRLSSRFGIGVDAGE